MKRTKSNVRSKACLARETPLAKNCDRPQVIYDLLKPQLENAVQEHGWVASMDCRGNVLGITLVGLGTPDHVEIQPREVYRAAIELAAQYVVLIHNHPSNETDPSPDDIELTKRIVKAGQIIGIPCVDHMIVCSKGFTSLSFGDKAKNVKPMPELHFPELVELDNSIKV